MEMKTETVKKLVRSIVYFAFLGAIITLSGIIYATYLFIINDTFATTPLYVFALFYGYLFGALGILLWYINNEDLLVKKAIERKIRKRRAA